MVEKIDTMVYAKQQAEVAKWKREPVPEKRQAFK
jgi:hypothetical protein